MFNKKLKIRLEELEGQCKRLREIYWDDMVWCGRCGCLLRKDVRFAVERGCSYGIGIPGDMDYNYSTEYYCLVHKPPYDRVVRDSRQNKDRYYRDHIEVDEKGKIIK